MAINNQGKRQPGPPPVRGRASPDPTHLKKVFHSCHPILVLIPDRVNENVRFGPEAGASSQ